jgi:hypothetical protein
MSRVIPWLVAALLLPVVMRAQPPAPARDASGAPQTGTASIAGRVVDAATGRPLSRVEVRVNPNPTNIEGRVKLTDAQGRYAIGGLPAGTYTVGVTKPNYVRMSWGEPRPEGPGKRIPITDGQKLGNIDFAVKRAGAVTGKIVDEFGEPVTDVFVQAMRYQYIQGSRRLMQNGRGGQTNDVGEYRIYGLSPGQYFVSATFRNFNGMGAADTGDRSSYAPTFYPGTGNVADAQRLTIDPGQTATGINLTLLPIQTAKVSGVALDADGKPIAGMINVMQRVGGTMIGNAGTSVRPDGKFTLSLTPGDYMLRIFGPNGSVGGETFAEVTVTGSDIDGLQLTTSKPSTIRGRIAFTDSATAAAPPKPTNVDLGAWRDWAIGQQVRFPAKIKDDGTFEISMAPGKVQIRAVVNGQPVPAAPGMPAQNWRLNRVMLNGIDIGDTGIDVGRDATIENVVVEMTNHSVEVTGHVTDADGNVVRDCFVIVFAQDPVRWTVQTRYLGVSRPSIDDAYHTRVLAGDYYVVAMTDVEVNAWTDAEFLARAKDLATKFSAADGEKKTVDLKVSPTPVF